MGKDSLQIALIKYNKKTWCKSAFLGFFIGLAVIVPGISGSTVAIIFKLYDSFLYALGNLLKKFKECFLFLFPIGIGAVIGVLLGFIAVDKLLELLPFAVVCLFAGLMTGAFPAVADEIKGAKTTKKRIALFALGLAIPLALGIYSAISVSSAGGLSADVFVSVQWWHVLISVLLGAMVGLTQIVPGLSASALLMAVGWFTGLVASVSMTYWKINPQIFLVYGGLAIGFVLGILLFSKLLTAIFEKARHSAYFMIVGLSLGSILSMFCNGDVMKVYLSWKVDVNLLDVILGVGLFAIGVVGAYLLVRYQRKKDAEKGENK
jgi:putative membrane protein